MYIPKELYQEQLQVRSQSNNEHVVTSFSAVLHTPLLRTSLKRAKRLSNNYKDVVSQKYVIIRQQQKLHYFKVSSTWYPFYANYVIIQQFI